MPRSCGNITLQFQVLKASEDGHTSQIAIVFRGFCLAFVLTGCGTSHYNCASVTAASAQGNWVAVWVYPARLTIEGKAIAGYPRLLGDGLVTAAADSSAALTVRGESIAATDQEQRSVAATIPNLDIFSVALSRMDGTAVILGSDRTGNTRRLLTISLLNRGAAHDLTSLLAGSETTHSSRLTISEDGKIVALSSPNECVVMDISAATIVRRIPTSGCSISPDGKRMALVAGNRGLVVMALSTGSRATWMRDSRVVGVGAWSPDSRYVTAGIFSRWSWYAELLAMNAESGDICKIADLQEGDNGSDLGWLNKHFLDAKRQPI